MSRSQRIFRMIERDLPDVVLCKDMLVVPPVERILTGFLLETTTERDRVYLWKVVTPLYRPMTGVILDYSDRIPDGGQDVYIDRKAYEKSAAAIRDIIVKEGHIEYLKTIRQPQDFLRHASWIVAGSPIKARIDRALSDYLIGHEAKSIEVLETLNAEIEGLEEARQQYIGPLVRRAVHELQTNPMGLVPLLDQWADQNVERFGLQAARSTR